MGTGFEGYQCAQEVGESRGVGFEVSVNQVTSIRPLYHCRELRELYLRKNAIKLSDLKEIHQLSTLRILWLTENPCVKESRYYEFLLRRLPLLQKLDNKAIESDNNNKQKEKQVGLSRDNTTFHYNKHKVAPIVSRSVGVQTEEASFRVDQHPSKPSIKKSGQLSIILSILLLLRELGIEEIHLIHEILEKYITSG
ncbi:hypothetical protein K7432_004125 [Basidiobolus ranarum]|uniref:Uncharacterized protein n=1 Tax=Basidiobolus ranarum TaxID=34480 RepID=A0ABR2W561_9FUNG